MLKKSSLLIKPQRLFQIEKKVVGFFGLQRFLEKTDLEKEKRYKMKSIKKFKCLGIFRHRNLKKIKISKGQNTRLKNKKNKLDNKRKNKIF